MSYAMIIVYPFTAKEGDEPELQKRTKICKLRVKCKKFRNSIVTTR